MDSDLSGALTSKCTESKMCLVTLISALKVGIWTPVIIRNNGAFPRIMHALIGGFHEGEAASVRFAPGQKRAEQGE